mgnify:CR=1 FL=1
MPLLINKLKTRNNLNLKKRKKVTYFNLLNYRYIYLIGCRKLRGREVITCAPMNTSNDMLHLQQSVTLILYGSILLNHRVMSGYAYIM